jgi:hypothetical protein
MALAYQGQFLVPTASTFTSSGIAAIYYQLSSGTAGGASPLQTLIGFIGTTLENQLGGSFTWTTTTVGSNYQIDITFTGLTTDPTTQPEGDLASLALVDDLGQFYTSALYNTCPDCPPSVNPEDATDCLSCYEQYAVNCATPITIQGLDASTEYVITISDNVSGKNYTYTTTTDTNGEADIDTADFPTGLFSPYNSPFTLTITENGVPVTLTYGYVNYSCISLNITNTETA